MSKEQNIPEINLKLETKEIKSGVVSLPYIIITPPYMILSDKKGTRKIWIKNKYKIALWFLYITTKIKWFIKKYNEQPR